MPPRTPPVRPNKGIRNRFLRAFEETKDLLKPPPRSGSQQSLDPSSSVARSPNIVPSAESVSTPSHRRPSHAGAPHPPISASAPSTPGIDGTEIDHPTLAVERGDSSDDSKKKWGQSWAGLETALQNLHRTVKTFPPLQSAVGTLISCLELVQVATKHHQDYEGLALGLESMTTLLEKHFRESGSVSMSDCVANVIRSIEAEAEYIDKKKEQSVVRGMVEASENADELVRCYRRIETLFRLLQVDADLSTWAITQEHLANTRLEAMSPAKAAYYDSAIPANVVRNECIEDTRVDVLSGMNTWSNNPTAPKMYWLNGMAGTGKTTIACSLSAALAERKQLGASFFCTRVLEECRDATRIIPTIAYQLARYSRSFQHILCKILENDPDITRKKIPMQFKRLLKEPLLSVRGAIPDNIVVVIDALDECDEDELVRTLLATIFQNAAELPLKFFVASRPEPKVLDEMQSQGEDTRSVLHLHEIERSSVQADIRCYLRKELAFMVPTEDEIEQLVQLSDGLFIYAATTVRYVRFRKKAVNPRERLRTVLTMHSDPNEVPNSNKMYAELDVLYKTILEGALDEDGLERVEVGRARLVLWTAVCVREPVTVKTLATLAGLCEENTQLILQSLRSVLHISEASNLVTTLHASFPDFVFTQERSQHFFCDKETHAPLLARQCFDMMKSELRFNICKLKSSFVPDKSIKDLDKRIEKYISQSLSYACQYWGDHLSLAAPTDSLCELLGDFLSNRLLFWLEVLNLSKPKPLGGIALQKMQSWLARFPSDAPPDITQLTSDAYHFVTLFSSNPVSICTPHIYISVLPFCHKSSSVFTQYFRRMKGLIDVKGIAIEHYGSVALASWDAGIEVASISVSPDGALIAFGGGDEYTGGMIGVINRHRGEFVVAPFQGHAKEVNSVAFSPDGARIVSASNDKTIRVWEAQDGLVAGPIKGHTGSVNSAAFSPDGTRIVSGSDDRTIRMWCAQDGNLIAGPFRGHTDCVNSVAFSPDGALIVSGSDDKTICIWRAQNGDLVAGPINGHTDSINSVAFSPDGMRIVSGSDDESIRVWGAQNGDLIAGPFEGHTDVVNSVAFSPDGTRIASGSDDGTVCVWSAQDDDVVAGPFKGHTDWVKSVAFLPDGTCIVSGADDETVCVWSAQGCNLTATADRFQGHTEPINSLAFSLDGKQVVSGSDDQTICVWGAENGNLVAGPIEGHTDCVNSVAFSPDSTRIVSGSDDDTICVWSAQSGDLVIGPIKGHTDSVNSVAFSPDGTRIVSGSDDKTICIWSVQNGDLVTGPIKRHTDCVNSVAFSPDGTLIASGSDDKTVRVWSAQGGTPIARPFKSHTDSVKSVAFSTDSTLIVSGSDDKTICVWSARDGNLVTGPIKGHAQSVNSVAFSPDGRRIVSGSDDQTICVWSAQDGNLIAGPFCGHTHSVESVVFSPDGKRILSSSYDCSIRFTVIWDQKTVPVPALSGDWDLKGSGWVVNDDEHRLFWVPQHLRPSLPHLHNPLVIGPEGSLQIDYSNVLLGESWSQCYVGM